VEHFISGPQQLMSRQFRDQTTCHGGQIGGQMIAASNARIVSRVQFRLAPGDLGA
jgi:hypothetical protein